MDKKHAYLIIAHNEFEILQKLVQALDYEMHDIYIHYDAKIKNYPIIRVKKSQLFILETRIDVCWGNVSQIECEYMLWEKAYIKREYDYYHLISGQHYPLQSAEYIYKYYNSIKNMNLFIMMDTNEEEVDAKIRRYNFFNGYMMSKRNKYCYKLGHFLWILTLKPQRIFKIKRYKKEHFYKSANWCSLTKEGVEYMLSIKRNTLKKYQHTFCADEFFTLTELMNSSIAAKCIHDSKILKVDFIGCAPRTYTNDNWEELKESGCLFARKFTQESLGLIKTIERSFI